jgi:hypothetical protein
VAGDPQQIVVVGAGRGEGEPGAPARQRFAGGTARPAPSLLAGVPNHERGCTNGPRDRSVPRLASSSAKPRYRQPKRPVILLGWRADCCCSGCRLHMGQRALLSIGRSLMAHDSKND